MPPRPAYRGPKPINLLKYHRPKLRLSQVREVPPLSKESRQCIRTLASYRLPKPRLKFPRSKCAAVLVALFAGRSGELHVLLSRRAATLRTFAGDTSLPGGKVDPEDKNFEDAARREAFEEIGLPRDRRKVPLLCVLDPFIASNQLIVVPVVVLIVDNTLRPILNSAEVASLFSHPLKAFVSSDYPLNAEMASLEVPHHSYKDHSLPPGPDGACRQMRVHQFLTGREAGGTKPVFGLTAAILIRVAMLGYRKEPDFEVEPPGAPTNEERIAWVMYSNPAFREACEVEGVEVEWESVRRIAEEVVKRDKLPWPIRSKL
ncbi:NUDIX hydrolase domain-like protein [Armillaria nabsnona]|nr:NUDIX hydrolase domain-like protein [Armillaria nabsnona]